MSYLENVFSFLQTITNDNQFLTGGLAVWAMSVLTYVMRSVPLKILHWLDRRFIARMTFDNSSWELRDLQTKFDTWYGNTKWISAVRDFRLMTTYDGHTILSPGGSINFFMIGWRVYWFTTNKDTQERMMAETVYITRVSTFSMWHSNRVFDNFISLFSERFDVDDNNSHYWVMVERRGEWCRNYRAKRRGWQNVAFNRHVRYEIDRALRNFSTRKPLYEQLGIDHKHTFMFYGEPGTGKTILADIMAGLTGFNIYPLSMENKTTSDFVNLLHSIPSNSILLLEDIDSFVTNRDLPPEEETTVETGPRGVDDLVANFLANDGGKKQKDSKMSLSGLLNILDGITPLNDLLVVITTNVLDELDPALYRKSRVDTLMEIKRFSSSETWDFLMRLYPELEPRPKVDLRPLRACEISELIRTYFDNSNALYSDLVLNNAMDAVEPIPTPKAKLVSLNT